MIPPVGAMFKSLIAGLGLVWIVGVSGASASEFVVIKATSAPDIPAPGARINMNYGLSLKPGQEMVLIAKSSEVLRITGPFSGPLGDHPRLTDVAGSDTKSTALQAISSLLTGENSLVATLGSSRNSNAGQSNQSPTDPWHPFITGTGTFCIDASNAILRRTNPDKAVKLTLVSPDFEFAYFDWKSGENELRLENPVVRDGVTYTLVLNDRSGESFVIARPAVFGDSSADAIAWMSEAGCVRQALRLVDQLIRAAK